MAFNGTLLKLNGTTFPLEYIKFETYNITPNQRMDLDSYRDLTGVLHRQVLKHTATKIEFQTPYMTEKKLNTMLSIINSSLSNFDERKVTVEYYDVETNTHKSGSFYMPDISYTIYNVVGTKIIYNPIRIAFIEY